MQGLASPGSVQEIMLHLLLPGGPDSCITSRHGPHRNSPSLLLRHWYHTENVVSLVFCCYEGDNSSDCLATAGPTVACPAQRVHVILYCKRETRSTSLRTGTAVGITYILGIDSFLLFFVGVWP
jgi:hypothetical protein